MTALSDVNQAALWDAFRAQHPGAELDTASEWAHGRSVRGRLAPGLPWTDWGWSLDRVLSELGRMAGGGNVVHLWSAGSASGTGRSLREALDEALRCLDGSSDVLVEEAQTVLVPAGDAGKVPVYEHTGKAWRLRVAGGVPSWEPPAGPEPEAVAG